MTEPYATYDIITFLVLCLSSYIFKFYESRADQSSINGLFRFIFMETVRLFKMLVVSEMRLVQLKTRINLIIDGFYLLLMY